MGDWRVGTVADAAVPRGLVGGPFGSKLVSRDYAETGVPVIRGKNLGQGRFVDLSDAVFVSHEKFARDLRTNDAKPGDLVFTQRGTLGQVAVMPSDAPIAVVSQSQMRLRVNHEVVDPWFVYYWATSPSFLRLLDDRAIVAGVPHINLGILAAMPLPLPPLDEQRRIAAVLGAFDDLIETNRALAASLEELQRADFLSQAKGQEAKLGDVAEVTMGQSPPGSSYNEDGIGATFYQGVRDFGWRFPTPRVWTTAPTRMAEEGDVLVAVRAPVGEVNVATETTALGRGLAGVRAHGRQSTLLQALTADPAIWDVHQGTGTVFASINKSGMNDLRIPWSTDDELEARLAAADDIIRGLADEMVELTRTRDELLPLLMSGRVRVEDVEGVV